MKRSLAQGFTLIELLIVIAVLGILAVAVLSAINPIEQINRSRDTGSRSDAEQLLGAVDRYYATAGYYPWRTSPPAIGENNATGWVEVGPAWTDGTLEVLNKLATAGTGELKGSFTTRIQGSSYNKLYVVNLGGAGQSTYVCFAPQSSAFRAEAGKRCDAGFGVDSDYPEADACPQTCTVATPDTCYSCLP